MAIYNDIYNWSLNKAPWVRDALRRLIQNQQISDVDINELYELLKKENTFTSQLEPIFLLDTHLPSENISNESPTVILSLDNPKNIDALYSNASLTFAENGLTIIYGDNGSGKSGYSRILKKNCWSRDRNVTLRKNVFSENGAEPQEVQIRFKNTDEYNFLWKESESIPHDLNSIYVFDSKCASIYVNNENPTEFKPVGFDILERLFEVFGRVQTLVDSDIEKCNKEKPLLDNKYSATNVYNWYSELLNKPREEIEAKIAFSEANGIRLNELKALLVKNDPAKENIELQNKIRRYNAIRQKFELIQNSFQLDKLKIYETIINDFKAKKKANEIASQAIKGEDPLNGIGTDAWKELWNAARIYAITNVHPENTNFPDSISKEICVFCQQPLNENAKNRLERFNLFIQDTTNAELQVSKDKLDNAIKNISNLTFEVDENVEEIISEIDGFSDVVRLFIEIILKNKKGLTQSLIDLTHISQPEPFPDVISLLDTKLQSFNKTIVDNNQLLQEKQKLTLEFLELEALKFLAENKAKIKEYFESEITKHWLNKAKSSLNTRFISQKIGEILQDKAIQEQHEEFIRHLSQLNSELANKIVIRKTRTSQGSTYQKCVFSNVNEPLGEILSEGEQKLIAIANFISECTLDNAKNSIVFDDPVTSLDQNYREAITKILTSLSSDRQVIVLSHDLNFVRLCIDEHKKVTNSNCHLIGLKSYRGISGIVTDEIPYLAKNIQERINTIRANINEIRACTPDQIELIEEKTELACKRIRFLLEKTVEDILANRTIQRFSKNITFKARQLASYVTVEQTDIDFLLNLYGKYSVTEHDGSTSVEYQKPDDSEIYNDLVAYEAWKNDFKEREKLVINASGVH